MSSVKYFLSLVVMITMMGFAQAETKFDGEWSVSVRNMCHPDESHEIMVNVINSQISTVNQNSLDIHGSIAYNGRVNVVIKVNDGKNNKVVHSAGKVSDTKGLGVYRVDYCPGVWRAAKQ